MPVVVESPDEILADLASLNGAATSAPVDSPDDILADLGRAKDDYMREYAYKLGGVDPKQRDVTYKNLAHTYRQEFKEEPDQAKFEKMLEKPFAGMPVGRVLQDKIQQYSKPELTSEHPAEAVVRRLPVAGALFSGLDSYSVYKSAKRIEGGEWTEEDLRNVAGFVATQQDRANDGWGAKTLNIISHLPGFGAEFAMTGPAFSAGRKATEKLAGAAIGKAASTAAGRVATSVAGFAGGTAARTAATPQRVFESAAERLTPQAIEERPDGGVNLPGKDEDLLTALPKGFLDTFIELGSEQAGAALVKPLGKVKQFLKHRWIGAAAGRTPQQFQKILDTAGWHGVLGEMFEERVGDVARSATGLQSWQEAVPTVEQLLSEAVAFSVPGAIGYAAGWAQQNPAAAAKIAEHETPSRKSFDEAGLPQMDAMQRKQFAAKLREALRQPKTFSFEQPVPQPQPQEPSNVLQQQVAPVQEPVQEQPAPGPQPAAQENVQVQPQVLEPPAPQQAQQAQQATATLPAVTPQVAQPGAENSPPPPAEPKRAMVLRRTPAEVNETTWYHGSGSPDITAQNIDPFYGSHESLFGHGVYLTDDPDIAKGYAKARGNKTKSQAVYRAKLNVGNVLDLEEPITPEVAAAIEQSFGTDFGDFIREQARKPGATTEQVLSALRKEIEEYSHQEMVPTSEFVELFQDLAINLRRAGIDALRHTGGRRTGKPPHNVVIVLDPHDVAGVGRGGHITEFGPHVESSPPAPAVEVPSTAVEPPAGPTLQQPVAIPKDRKGQIKALEALGYNQIYAGDLTTPQREERIRLGKYSFQAGDQVKLPTYKGADSTGVIRAVRPDGTYDVLVGTDRVLEKQPWYTMTPTGVRVVNPPEPQRTVKDFTKRKSRKMAEGTTPKAMLDEAVRQHAGEDPVHQGTFRMFVEHAYEENRMLLGEQVAAMAELRSAGLSKAKISKWEEAGKDYSEWPGLDDFARSFAGEHPGIGLPYPGQGEERLGGRDPANYPEELWNWIKRAPERLPPKHSDEVIRRANQLFQDNLQYIQREQGDGGRRIEGEGQGVGEGQVEEAGPEAEAAGVSEHRGELPGRPSSEEERFELEQEPASGVTEPRQREPGEDDEPFEDTGESGGLDDVPFSPTARPTDPILGSSANHAMPMRLDRPTSKVKLTGPHEVIEAMADATEAFGRRTPFRTKRISERTAAGIFKVGPEVVRIRQALDIPVAAHEMAHALEKIVFGWPKGSPWRNPLVSGPLQKELLALGKALYPGPNPPVGGWKREGWAEYVRMWVTIPANAQKYAPKLTDWFESEFLPQHPAGAGALQEARERARRWQEQGSYQRGKSTTVDTGTIGQRAKRAKEAIKKGLAIEQHIDMLEPYRLLVEQIEERSGKKLSITEDPYRTGKALRRTHEGRTRAMVEQGMIDLAGNIVGPALSDIRKIVQPSQYTDFVLYLRARRARALWLDKYGPRDPGMTLNDAQQIIKEVETPELQIAAQKFYDWNDGVLNYAAQASPTFAAIVTRIRQRDPGDYAPLYRVFEDLDERINRRPGGVSAKGGSITARLRGSGRRVKDPFQQAISNASRLVRAAHDRLILDQLIRLSRREGAGNIIEEVPREKIPAHSVYLLDLLAEVEKRLSAQNIDLDVDMDAVSNELVTFFEHAKTPVGNDPIIPIVQQGEIKWYYVRKDLYEALTGMDGYRLPAVVDLIHGPFHRAFKAGTVGVRASFSLITNPARDVQNLYLQTKSKANFGKLFKTWIQSVGQAALHKFSGGTISDETLDLFERLGGQIALPLGEDIPETRRAARRVFQGRVVRVLDLRNTWDWLREVLQFPESATRATEIKLLGEDIGWKPGQPMTVEQSLELLLAAKEVTTDFSAAGKFARVMNQIVPFYNANIQGPRASWRALRRTPTTFLWRGAQLAAISLLLWWKYRDEEWWKELEPREKYTHWHFPVTVGDREELVRLPISPGINSIFSTLPVALADAWYKQSPKEASEWFENFVEGSNPAGLPVLAREAGEQLANRDFYTEKPIVTGEMQGKPAAEQQNEYTSQVAVFLGKQLGWSPARIDHAIRGIGGGVARDVVEAVGLGGRSTKRADEPANLPVIGRLFSRGGPLGTRPKSISQLYDTLGEAQTRQRSSEEPETPKERALRLMLNDAATAVSALLYARSQSGKTDDRRQITEHATAIARQAVSQYQKGDVRRSGLSIVDERLQEIKTIRKRGFEEEADRRLQALAKAIGGRAARLQDSP